MVLVPWKLDKSHREEIAVLGRPDGHKYNGGKDKDLTTLTHETGEKVRFKIPSDVR